MEGAWFQPTLPLAFTVFCTAKICYNLEGRTPFKKLCFPVKLDTCSLVGTTMRRGPHIPFPHARCASKAIAMIVFPIPVASARTFSHTRKQANQGLRADIHEEGTSEEKGKKGTMF